MEPVLIHGFAPSTYTRTARMAAIEKGVSHRLVPIAYGQPEHFALHPYGKMPVLTHAGVTVFETLAIVDYLDTAFDGPALIPRDAAMRTRAMTAASVAIDYAYRPVVHGEGDADGSVAARVLDWLEAGLARDRYLAGPDVSFADLMLAPMIDFHLARTDADRVFGHRPHLKRWHREMVGRPSFAETAAGAA